MINAIRRLARRSLRCRQDTPPRDPYRTLSLPNPDTDLLALASTVDHITRRQNVFVVIRAPHEAEGASVREALENLQAGRYTYTARENMGPLAELLTRICTEAIVEGLR